MSPLSMGPDRTVTLGIPSFVWSRTSEIKTSRPRRSPRSRSPETPATDDLAQHSQQLDRTTACQSHGTAAHHMLPRPEDGGREPMSVRARVFRPLSGPTVVTRRAHRVIRRRSMEMVAISLASRRPTRCRFLGGGLVSAPRSPLSRLRVACARRTPT